MKISVVICTYNRSKSLEITLKSLKEMSVAQELSWELVVVDNKSDDNTKDVVEEFRLNSGINVRYVFEGNQGQSHARNRGVKEAKGEIIAFTDDDVIVDKKWVSNIVKAFEENSISCVGGKILPIWERPCPKWLNQELQGYLALLDYGDLPFYIDKAIIWGANFSVKASMFQKYGQFNPLLGRVGGKLYSQDDTKYVKLLIENGEKVLYAPNIIVHHQVPVKRMNKSYFRKWKFDQGELDAIILGNYENRNILGIPYYEIRYFLKKMLEYLVSIITFSENRFLYELKVIYSIGFIVGRIIFKRRNG